MTSSLRERTSAMRFTDRRTGGWLLALFLTLPLAGCQSFLDNLLEADTPGSVLNETLRNPNNADLLVVSIQTDLHCAFGDYTVVSGLVGDEITWADNNSFDYDRRTFSANAGNRNYATTPCGTGIGLVALGVYTPLSTARHMADYAHEILSGFTDAQVPGGLRPTYLATTTLYGAYATLLIGEAMCEASIEIGPILTRRQLFELAEQKFTAGIAEAQAASNANLVNLGLVGRARTRLNLFTNPSQYGGSVAAKGAEAVADAQLVPDGFVWNATYATADNRGSNKVWWWNNDQVRVSIDAPYWNLAFQGVPDPRVNLIYTGRTAFDGNTPLVQQTKYLLRDSPIPLARWAEAQLIIAEVLGGQQAVDIINVLHTRAGLPPFASNDPTEIHDQVITERKRELFLESQHLNDKIRLGLPFVPAAGTPYKLTGGGTYGSGSCFPYPDEERFNNPNAG